MNRPNPLRVHVNSLPAPANATRLALASTTATAMVAASMLIAVPSSTAAIAAPPTAVPVTAAAATAAVEIGDDYFRAQDVAVFSGGTVTWTNTGDPHTATSTGSGVGFDSGRINGGASWSHTFPTVGAFPYVCDYHSDMTGTVTVTAAPPDTTKPRVVSKTPVRTAAKAANFVAKFSERVKLVSGSTMRLYLKGRVAPLPARVTLSADGKTATLNPSSNLVARKVYTLKLSAGIKDRAGNSLTATSWSATAR